MDKLKIKFAHACETAFFSQDKKANIIGMFDVMRFNSLPVVQYKLSVLLNVEGVLDKMLSIIIESPNGTEESKLSLDPATIDKGEEDNTNISVMIESFNVKEVGVYKIRLENDEGVPLGEKVDLFKVVLI